MRAIEEYPAELNLTTTSFLTKSLQDMHLEFSLLMPSMAVLQSMTKTRAIQKLSDLRNAFTRRTESVMNGYNEGRVIFYRYLDQSPKDKTRQKKATTSTEFAVHPEMKLIMSTKELLSS